MVSPTITNHARVIRIGTRKSQLALWQSKHVARLIESTWPDVRCELHHVVTQGDLRLDRPLPEIGGKGLFTAELEAQLLDGSIDIAVHSLKDLPVEDAPGLTVGAIPPRADVRDVLVAPDGHTLATLPAGSVVGTSSLRRQAQILAARPDLHVQPIRGNVETRLRKVSVGDYSAAMMAGAGLLRLGLDDQIAEWMTHELMLPAPGQGALGIQCREDDNDIHEILALLDDPVAHITAQCERRLLWALGGGCSAPIGAAAQWLDDTNTLKLSARIASLDGKEVFSAEATTSSSTLEDLLADSYSFGGIVRRVVNELCMQGAQRALVQPAPDGPLKGKRVVVTRSSSQAMKLGEPLAQAGAEPIFLPLIQIEPMTDLQPTQRALRQLESFHWIIFTSVNAVNVFLALSRDAGQPFISSKSIKPRIAAVGPATRERLYSFGITVDAMPEDFLGAAIPEAMGDLKGKRVLLPRSARAKERLPSMLEELGAEVVELETYTTVAVKPSARALSQLQEGIDVLTFTSGSTVEVWHSLTSQEVELPFDLEKLTIACIGPSTAEVATKLGLRVDIVAQEHTLNGMVEAIVAHYADEGGA